jgi:hypothetical protein
MFSYEMKHKSSERVPALSDKLAVFSCVLIVSVVDVVGTISKNNHTRNLKKLPHSGTPANTMHKTETPSRSTLIAALTAHHVAFNRAHFHTLPIRRYIELIVSSVQNSSPSIQLNPSLNLSRKLEVQVAAPGISNLRHVHKKIERTFEVITLKGK